MLFVKVGLYLLWNSNIHNQQSKSTLSQGTSSSLTFLNISQSLNVWQEKLCRKKSTQKLGTNLDKAGLLITYQKNDENKPNCEKTRKIRINVTFMSVRVTTAAVEKQPVLHILCVCVCSLSYPSCAVLYFRLWPVCLYNTFPPYLTNSMTFEWGS